MTVYRERQRISREVSRLEVSNVNLGKVLAQVQALISQYGTNARVDIEAEKYSDREYVQVCVTDLETDEELAQRIAREEQHDAYAAAYERAEYERLKTKFG